MFSAATKTGSQPGGGAANYIEDVFSTYLYTGTGATLAINNGIDLSTKGGLTWIKRRGSGTGSHELFDTVRGVNKYISSNSTAAQDANGAFTDLLTSFNSNGFTLGADASLQQVNSVGSGDTYCSWTFAEQEKFFDIVTYTGNGSAPRAISHNLGSTPGMVIIKKTSATGDWLVYHRSSPSGGNLYLNSSDAADAGTNPFLSAVSSTTFTLSTNQNATTNANGATYVAYLFAHDAGGFGTSGTDNVISCGTFTTDANGNTTVNLGYEPQYLMYKSTSAAGSWTILDTMRGFCATADSSNRLAAQSSSAESPNLGGSPSATGFYGDNANSFAASNTTYIYMAIRRPMKVPTTGTSVFSPIISSATQGTKLTTGFPVDLQILGKRAGDSDNMTVIDRLRKFSSSTTESNGNFLETSNTGAENTGASESRARYWDNTGFQMPGAYSGESIVFWNFSRRPGFFDVVCYTGTGTYGSKNHNLGVVPELLIGKTRSSTGDWYVWSPILSATPNADTGYLNSTAAFFNYWGVGTIATSTTFEPYDDVSSTTYVTYLFATCAGVSKVGSYTGAGATQTINCGFTGGARYVLIKRTDSTGNWFVWDTARGMVSGTDPRYALNLTSAETNANWVYTATTGFQIVTTDDSVNASGGTYIFLAIA